MVVAGGQALVLAGGPEEGCLLDDRLGGGVGVDHPGIAHSGGPLHRGVGVGRDPDRRPGLLHGLGVEGHRLQAAPFEIGVDVVGGPESLDQVEIGLEPPHLGLRIEPEAVVLHLAVSQPHTEGEPPTAQDVDRCPRLGHVQRVVEREQQYPDPDLHGSALGGDTAHERHALRHGHAVGQVVLPGPDRVPAPVADLSHHPELVVHPRHQVGAYGVLVGEEQADLDVAHRRHWRSFRHRAEAR